MTKLWRIHRCSRVQQRSEFGKIVPSDSQDITLTTPTAHTLASSLASSLIVSTAIYACETWKSTVRICQKLDVFHQRNLRKIPGVTWRDHMSNIEVLKRTGQRRLQEIVAERRLRTAGHIIRMPPGRPANRAMSWTPRGSGRKRGRPTKTWRSTFKEDLVDRGVDWNSVRAVATDRHRWRTLAAHRPDKDWRI